MAQLSPVVESCEAIWSLVVESSVAQLSPVVESFEAIWSLAVESSVAQLSPAVESFELLWSLVAERGCLLVVCVSLLESCLWVCRLVEM